MPIPRAQIDPSFRPITRSGNAMRSCTNYEEIMQCRMKKVRVKWTGELTEEQAKVTIEHLCQQIAEIEKRHKENVAAHWLTGG